MKKIIWIPVWVNGVPEMVPLKYDEPVRLSSFSFLSRCLR